MALVRAYLAAAVGMAILDMLWLGVVAKGLYRRDLGHLMAPEVRWWAAVLFYLVYAGGIVHFAVRPALAKGGPRDAARGGAAVGLLVYAVYDLTNLALLRGWTVRISVLDVVWGGAATAAVAAAAYAAAATRR